MIRLKSLLIPCSCHDNFIVLYSRDNGNIITNSCNMSIRDPMSFSSIIV